MKKTFSILLLLALAACDSQYAAEEPKAPVARLPAEVCKQASEGLSALKESGGFTYAGAGEGALEEQAWLQMSEPQRDQLLQLLAYDAACTAKEPPADATATIRNETGRILSQRVVETSADLSKVLGE
jgi:hypothetical protein